ncbi:Uncharacterised protein [Mycobacteroides abscessus subsp. abscessus]|nr:Uncharacterised protein [Mycobacteroides abscessus subsp. abscessus]
MANEDDDAMLVGDFNGGAAYAPLANVPNAAVSGFNVDQGLNVVEIEIDRRQASAAGIGYHAGVGFGKTDLRRRGESA